MGLRVYRPSIIAITVFISSSNIVVIRLYISADSCQTIALDVEFRMCDFTSLFYQRVEEEKRFAQVVRCRTMMVGGGEW